MATGREYKLVIEPEQRGELAAEWISLEDALARFIFISDGSRVVDANNPLGDMACQDFERTFAGSVSEETVGNRIVKTPIPKQWLTSNLRMTAKARTFKAGAGLRITDPKGNDAVNSWVPFTRESRGVSNKAGVKKFLDHIEWLFADQAPQFIEWLAHIEQKPGSLPHAHWIHVSRETGTGRNWLCQVLRRVWPSNVAANFDLVGTLKSGFNDELSRSIFAFVDEINEGGRSNKWEHSEKLKSILTSETRTINPKYGRKSIEFNSTRWLLLSNHISAIPLDDTDRRFWVARFTGAPKPPEYYSELYRLLEDDSFIRAVAKYLASYKVRDDFEAIRPEDSQAKRELIDASLSEEDINARTLVKHWPVDLITYTNAVYAIASGNGLVTVEDRKYRNILEHAGAFAMTQRIRINCKVTRIRTLRNKEKWDKATPDEIRAELSRTPSFENFDGSGDYKAISDYLLELGSSS